MKRTAFLLIVILAAASLLAACSLFGKQQTPKDINAISTLAQQTVIARQTQAAFETLVAQLTQVIQNTPVPPQVTVQAASPTPQPLPSDTQVPPTQGPTATGTPLPTPCNWVGFVKDVTITDGTGFLPGETFTKIWRLKNIGSCDWTGDYALVFASGNAMNGAAATSLGTTIKPGQTIDVAVKLTAPGDAGEYTGNWMLRTNTGTAFGLGKNANGSFYVKIEVVSRTTIKDANITFDFTRNYCAADWRNSAGALACPSMASDTQNGSIFRVLNPVMEIGNADDEAALVVSPNDGAGGTITGLYPAYKVKSGDHFKAEAACADQADKCDVTFQFGYRKPDGSIQALGTWVEKYDGNTSKIDIDLSGLVDQSLQFVLIVTNNGSSSGDIAMWFAPRITH